MRKFVFAFAILASILITACSSDNNDDSINKNKQYPVSYNLNTEQEGFLYNGYRSLIIDSIKTNTDKLGYKGLLIYTDKNGNPTAFDLACPNCWNGNILTKRNTPTDDYDCLVCGLNASLSYGRGYFRDDKGNITKSMDLVKYEVTKKAVYEYEISNPK